MALFYDALEKKEKSLGQLSHSKQRLNSKSAAASIRRASSKPNFMKTTCHSFGYLDTTLEENLQDIKYKTMEELRTPKHALLGALVSRVSAYFLKKRESRQRNKKNCTEHKNDVKNLPIKQTIQLTRELAFGRQKKSEIYLKRQFVVEGAAFGMKKPLQTCEV